MPEEIIKQVAIKGDHQHHTFEYDANSGFLRNQDGAYLLFRAESQGNIPSSRTHGDLADDKTASYGKGLYTGNTPEAVAPYVWTRPENIINAYLTPQLEDGRVYNHAQLPRLDAAKEYLKMTRRRSALGWRAVSEQFDAERGDALLATIDAGFDIATGQKLLSHTKHSVPPRWGIWRGDSADLTHLGTAQAQSIPYDWAVRIARRTSRK